MTIVYAYGYEHSNSTQKGLKDKTIWYGYEGLYSDSTQKGLKKQDHIVWI